MFVKLNSTENRRVPKLTPAKTTGFESDKMSQEARNAV